MILLVPPAVLCSVSSPSCTKYCVKRRRWDAGPALRWDGHEVTPHFVHLPSGSERISGLWAEVALDGLVLFERELAVSRYLADVRRRILHGELSYRVAGGQSYWVREP